MPAKTDDLLMGEGSFTITDGPMYRTVLLKDDCQIEYDITHETHLLIINCADKDITLTESGVICSTVNITYIDLKDHSLKHNSRLKISENASLFIKTYYLGTQNKDIVFDLLDDGRNASCSIQNSAVCLKDSHFSMNIIGSIPKGAKGAKMHQKSNCLTLGKPLMLKVDPILKIDENDVEASHSLSSGTIDRHLLYYMNARGLSDNEALVLLIKGYLLPEKEDYLAYPEGAKWIEECGKEANRLCLM